jgi:osmotically-inducible protein OsmY
MVRAAPLISRLPAALAITGLAFATVGLSACWKDDSEARLAEATHELEKALTDVENAQATVDARRAEMETARDKLAKAEDELTKAKRRLDDAKAEVDADATDTLVFRSVQRRLLDDKKLEGVAIAARVESGVVTLSGDAPDDAIRKRALEIARETPGVARVQDRIRVEGEKPAVPQPAQGT